LADPAGRPPVRRDARTSAGRDNPSLAERVAAIQRTVEQAPGEVILVAHSAGVISAVHWAMRHRGPVRAALLATPPDLGAPLPPEYPSLEELERHGWLPIPRRRLPFPSIVAASANDSLGDPARVRALAYAWGSRWHELGAVGHLNPASGYGNWPEADVLVNALLHPKGASEPRQDLSELRKRAVHCTFE
jgi:predicted alpha/beta hydrolase family esterase